MTADVDTLAIIRRLHDQRRIRGRAINDAARAIEQITRDLVAGHDAGIAISELAAAAGVSRQTAYNLLASAEIRAYAEQDES